MDVDDKHLKQTAINIKDALELNPEQRAELIYSKIKESIPDATVWDLVCFSAQFLGLQAHNLQWLELPAKHICRLVYTAHYIDTQTDTKSGFPGRNTGPIESFNPSENSSGSTETKLPGPDKPRSLFE